MNSSQNPTLRPVDSAVTTYEYDSIDQLLSESRTGYSASYTYDANGNRASKTLGSTTETYTNDTGDKLTEIKSGSTTIKSFSYDTAGRTTGITHSGSTTTIAYDYESRVTSITRSGVTTNTNSYNGLDTRYSAVDSTGTKTFKRAGAGVLAPVLGDGSAVYTPGISERRSSTTTYSHPGIKSGEAQSSTSQVIGATRQYDAFGNLDSSSGTWKGPFGYGGRFGYQETGDHGLRLLGHRYYDSNTGRFLTRDPIKDGRNWYGYCGNRPISMADPTGLLFSVVLLGTLIFNENDGYGHLIVPPGVSVDDNIRLIEVTLAGPPRIAVETPGMPLWSSGYETAFLLWLDLVRPQGQWDYKDDNRSFENFGNFNYGATGAVLMSLDRLLAGSETASQWTGRGTDEEKDIYWIARGYKYYHSNH